MLRAKHLWTIALVAMLANPMNFFSATYLKINQYQIVSSATVKNETSPRGGCMTRKITIAFVNLARNMLFCVCCIPPGKFT